MLPGYGVVIGEFGKYTTEQGRWMHVDLNIEAAGVEYQAAVDVNEPNGLFQYQILNNLDAGLFAAVSGLADGWHDLKSNATSGAMDYALSPILKGLFAEAWTDVTGNEAGEAVVALVTGSTKLYAFGSPYTTGHGVHDVHCNQGDPPGEFQGLDGSWQDGCVFVLKGDGSLSAYLGKFSTQTLKNPQP
jgi:Uncharacterized conserved protein (DUF2278)